LIGGAYAHLEGGTDSDDNGRIDADLDGANISPDRLNLFADWEWGRVDARATMRHYFERQFEGQDPRNSFAGYTLVDADVGYRFGTHRVSLSMLNVTDRQFITYFSDTQGPSDDLRYFAGRGRTFTLGLTSRW
jgi:iron complex outermembrane receptor protein